MIFMTRKQNEDEAIDLRKLLVDYLQYYKMLGLDGLYIDAVKPKEAKKDRALADKPTETPPAPSLKPPSPPKPPNEPRQKGQTISSDAPKQLTTLEKKIILMRQLEDEIRQCQRCPLFKRRKHTVLGEGDLDAELMFIGEAPGEKEDEQGKPFVGAAGELLTKMIEAMQLSREQVYIGNIVKCRPPGNRNPLPGEARQCLPYIEEQIRIVSPKVIVALGAIAARYLLSSERRISDLRGKFHQYALGIKVMPTFHPARLFHNPGEKILVWSDLKMVMQELGIPIPDRKKQ